MVILTLMISYVLIPLARGTTTHYFSNFEFGPLLRGPSENVIQDYLTLAKDPKANFPESFTICTSLHVQFSTTPISVIKVLREDETHWFNLVLEVRHMGVRDQTELSEKLEIHVNNPLTNRHEIKYFPGTIIPIVPHSWYHFCMGLNSVSGLLRIVVNGREVVNEEKDYFKNTNKWKPKSLAGKITHFKAYLSGLWAQSRSKFSNQNIFRFVMSLDDMLQRTLGEGCSSPGDYLR